MTIEEYCQWDKPGKYVYQRDEVGVALLKDIVYRPAKVIHVVNAFTAKTYIPKARQDLPRESQNEAVYCNTCHTYLPIRRVRPKIASGVLSNQFSKYITNALVYCNCKSSAVLVDNRGMLRVYGSSNNLSLVNYLDSWPLHHLLGNQKHAEIDRRLIEGVRPKYDRVTIPRHMWYTNYIDMTHVYPKQQDILLPTEHTSMSRVEYHRAYAYMHRIAILTDTYLILPSGILISRRNSYLKGILDQPVELPTYIHSTPNATLGSILRSTKWNYQVLQLATDTMSNLIDQLEEHFQLPKVSSKIYPFQVIGHLQIARLDQAEPTPKRISQIYAGAITATRNAARNAIRALLLGKTYRPNLRPLQPVSPQAFIYSRRIRKAPTIRTSRLKQHDGYVT